MWFVTGSQDLGEGLAHAPETTRLPQSYQTSGTKSECTKCGGSGQGRRRKVSTGTLYINPIDDEVFTKSIGREAGSCPHARCSVQGGRCPRQEASLFWPMEEQPVQFRPVTE
jgi:hypothetical protein